MARKCTNAGTEVSADEKASPPSGLPIQAGYLLGCVTTPLLALVQAALRFQPLPSNFDYPLFPACWITIPITIKHVPPTYL